MKLSSRRIVSVIAVACALGLVGWAYWFHARSEWALADYKKQLRDSGERLTVDELLPRPVDLESNGARILQRAQSYFLYSLNRTSLLDTNAPEAMRMVAPGKAMIGWQQPDLREEGTNTWEQAEATLDQERQGLEGLEEIIQHPALDFHLDYHQGFTLLLPHLAKLKQAAQRLKSAAVCDLRKSDTARATTRICAMLAITKGMEDERLVISQLVRFAIANIALAANWELLQSPQVNEAELARLQTDWMAFDFIKGAENALLMERGMGEEAAEALRESSANYRTLMGMGSRSGGGSSGDWLGDFGRAAVDKGKETMWRYAWASPDQLRGLQGKQVLLEALRRRETGEGFKTMLAYQDQKLTELGIQQRATNDEGLLFGGEDPRYLFTDSVRALERLPHRLLAAEAGRQLLVTAIALKRSQLKHGSYPSDLAALQPDFLAGPPLDPVDGQLLRYKLNPDGTFLLYSIGEDGEDNGGDPTATTNSKTSFPWLKGRDVVWPRAATDAEVLAYRQKLQEKR